MTAREIAARVNRTQSRVTNLLTNLRREGKVTKFKVRSTYYWIKSDRQRLVISSEKSGILGALSRPLRLSEIARTLSRDPKSVSRRLAELSEPDLVEKVNSNWRKIEVQKRVIIK